MGWGSWRQEFLGCFRPVWSTTVLPSRISPWWSLEADAGPITTLSFDHQGVGKLHNAAAYLEMSEENCVGGAVVSQWKVKGHRGSQSMRELNKHCPLRGMGFFRRIYYSNCKNRIVSSFGKLIWIEVNLLCLVNQIVVEYLFEPLYRNVMNYIIFV